jgi:hypothetical protein
LWPAGLAAQVETDPPEKDCSPKDIRDLFRKKDKPPKKERNTMLLLLPNVSSNPANGLLIGAAGTAGFFLGPRASTRVSSLGFNAAYTTKKQFLSFLKSNIYTAGDRFFLQGDWRFFIYRAPTWGLGTSAPDTIETDNDFIWLGALPTPSMAAFRWLTITSNYTRSPATRSAATPTSAWATTSTIFTASGMMPCSWTACPLN